MNVLGIEGALGGFSAAVARNDEIVSAAALEGNVALEAGLSAVHSVMQSAEVSVAGLDRLAVGIGPGGFTGLRITIAYAKSLAQAWRLPLVGISSFDTLEFGLSLERVLTVIVGRPGVISARYRDARQERRASGPTGEVLHSVLSGQIPGSLEVLGASEDALAALAEAGFAVKSISAQVAPHAAAIALAGSLLPPAATLHEVRADYGEAPAAKVPQF
jgi:tRNA threonylcarbamoyl adenosine modification protein YeaZ